MRRKIHGDEGDVRTEKCQGRPTVYFEDPFWVVTPNGRTTVYSCYGVIETGIVSNAIDNDIKKIYKKCGSLVLLIIDIMVCSKNLMKVVQS